MCDSAGSHNKSVARTGVQASASQARALWAEKKLVSSQACMSVSTPRGYEDSSSERPPCQSRVHSSGQIQKKDKKRIQN